MQLSCNKGSTWVGGGDKKSWGKDKRMSVGTQGVFRLFHYDFKPWDQWILLPSEVLVRAAVHGGMSHCHWWLSVMMAQCLYLSGSRSYVLGTCLVSSRRQGVSLSHLNFIHSGICWNIWWCLVLETSQGDVLGNQSGSGWEFSALLCCTALGDLEVLHGLTFRKLKCSVQGCH